jgi:DNA-binding response OmpR family regulator
MRILLVEDELDLGAAIQRDLKREKYVVDWVQNGDEAWHLLGDAAPSYTLGVFDWLLPGLTGIELCQRLRSQGTSMPVLLLTPKIGCKIR